jgi:hypothetical protein
MATAKTICSGEVRKGFSLFELLLDLEFITVGLAWLSPLCFGSAHIDSEPHY